jgi:hypothetical protein
MTAEIGPAVEREVRELEWSGASFKAGRVGRIQQQVGRRLVRDGESVGRVLVERARVLVEGCAPEPVVAFVERVEIRAAEGDLSRRAGSSTLGAADEPERRPVAERGAGGSRQRQVLELVVKPATSAE